MLWLVSVAATWLVYRPDRIAMIDAADVIARYTLGVTGAFIAAWAIRLEQNSFRQRGMAGFGRALLGVAVTLGLDGLSQIFTRPSFIFPSTVLNNALFIDLFGFPVQLLRAVLACSWPCSSFTPGNVFEVQNQQRLAEAVEQRAAAQREALAVQQRARRRRNYSTAACNSAVEIFWPCCSPFRATSPPRSTAPLCCRTPCPNWWRCCRG